MAQFEVAPALIEAVAQLPSQPGVYFFKDARGTILYVGKAKNLRQRVRQYLDNSRHHDAKTVALMRKATTLDWIITDTEVEALLLENNLIKEHKPRYNILLKDDKTYPYIRITNEEYPRIFPTRRVVRDGSLYFGPYANVQSMHFVLKTIRTLFPIRSCSLPLNPENIARGKFKVCLDYHIGKCEGPCVGLVGREHYHQHIEDAINFLRGKTKLVEQHLEEQMHALAEKMKFEQAAVLRDRLQKLRSYVARQNVVTTELIDRDVLGAVSEDGHTCIVLLITREGKVIGKQQWIVPSAGSETADIVCTVLERWYLETDDLPSEILLPLELGDQADFLLQWFATAKSKRLELIFPKIGEKRKLVALAIANAQYQLRDYLLHRAKREQAIPRSVAALQRDLRLTKPPLRIECFDNSHIQGSEYVSSMVVFANGKPVKSEYRRYRLRNVSGNDDFQAMAEVIRRRYERLLREQQQLPDLIVVDGGKGQLSAACAVMEQLGLSNTIPIIALAKRLEEIFLPGEHESLLLPRTSSSLRLLQHIRDEAHRFAVDYHRLLRSKRTLTTELVSIAGVGEKTATKLLQHFGSVAALKQKTVDEIATIVGHRTAQVIYSYFHTSPNNAELTIEEL